MDEKEIFYYLRASDCCSACCIRFIGLRNPSAYDNIKSTISKFTENSKLDITNVADEKVFNVSSDSQQLERDSVQKADGTRGDAKRQKWSICVACLGLLQDQTWSDWIDKLKEQFDKKKYSCESFACALCVPSAVLLRERVLILALEEKFPGYISSKSPTPLKEAWRWIVCKHLQRYLGKTMDSGATSPLLATINMEYVNDMDELERLKCACPAPFDERNRSKKKYCSQWTRPAIEAALHQLTLDQVKTKWSVPPPQPTAPVTCVNVLCTHAPLYIGGRYIKLSRSLPQTPWVINGRRIMESSVQEIIFEPIAKHFMMELTDLEHRLKLLSAGREDVDVRCLGSGRPFAIEALDPSSPPTDMQLAQLSDQISQSNLVRVEKLQLVNKQELSYLKQGEESKTKVYEALCIKLNNSKYEMNGDASSNQVKVTEDDIIRINSYSAQGDSLEACRIQVRQKTPLRVLHRRPLLTRTRRIHNLKASTVPGHDQLFRVCIRCDAGTYVKEWVHGDLGRTKPSLADALGARCDILALDVTAVELDWPTSST